MSGDGKQLISEHYFPVRWTVRAAPHVTNAHVERPCQICEGLFERRDQARVVRKERHELFFNLNTRANFERDCNSSDASDSANALQEGSNVSELIPRKSSNEVLVEAELAKELSLRWRIRRGAIMAVIDFQRLVPRASNPHGLSDYGF